MNCILGKKVRREELRKSPMCVVLPDILCVMSLCIGEVNKPVVFFSTSRIRGGVRRVRTRKLHPQLHAATYTGAGTDKHIIARPCFSSLPNNSTFNSCIQTTLPRIPQSVLSYICQQRSKLVRL